MTYEACKEAVGSEALRECDWPANTPFKFLDEPGEHDPCYVVMPGGAMLSLNHHVGEGVDIARAKFIVAACNAALVSADSNDEFYELGKRDGYEDAIQDLDIATGGDGEFKGSTIPGETVDVPAMKARIISRAAPVKAVGSDALREDVFAAAAGAFAQQSGADAKLTGYGKLKLTYYAQNLTWLELDFAECLGAALDAALAHPGSGDAEPGAEGEQ